MSLRPRRHVADLVPVYHGNVSDAELVSLGLTRDQVIDFSVNSNPLGPSKAAMSAALEVTWAHYPDDMATALRRELAKRERVAEVEIIVANGSVDLMWLIAQSFLDPGDAAVIAGPTFGEYARAARIAGAIVHELRAQPTNAFAVDCAALIDLVRSVRARVVFLCNPNNPTGVHVPLAALDDLALAAPESLIVIDEAYRQFADQPLESNGLLARGNVLLLRSLTKDYAIAGLRLGYAIAPESIRAALDAVRPPWSVNSVAQAVGLAAIRDEAHLEAARLEVRRARAFVTAELSALGWRVLPSVTNFVLVEVGNAPRIRAALLRHGVCVRDCTSFGLPQFIRIGLRTVPECQKLVVATKSVLGER